MEIENLVVKQLKDQGWHISFAESCTAGLATATIANVSGSSDVLDASVVTYANEAKVRFLHVDPQTIAEYGVVSEQVAAEMCSGIALLNHAEVGVGITGVAGPTGGTALKPVGMVCFGIWINGMIHTYTRYFGEIGRQNVRQASVTFVLETLHQLLGGSI